MGSSHKIQQYKKIEMQWIIIKLDSHYYNTIFTPYIIHIFNHILLLLLLLFGLSRNPLANH